jgi:hypothetical protein
MAPYLTSYDRFRDVTGVSAQDMVHSQNYDLGQMGLMLLLRRTRLLTSLSSLERLWGKEELKLCSLEKDYSPLQVTIRRGLQPNRMAQ